MDEAVPVTNTRMWVDTMKEMKLNYEYKEIPGANHGSVIEQGMPADLRVFKGSTRSNRKGDGDEGLRRVLATVGSAGLALCLSVGLIQTPSAFGQAPAGKQAKGINRPPDPRVQQRTYHFADTNEDLPYAVYRLLQSFERQEESVDNRAARLGRR